MKEAAVQVRPAPPALPKPRLRGWIHAVMAPISVIVGIVLVLCAQGTTAKITCAIFALTGIILFTTSAIYHRGNWSPAAIAVLRRMDHANIFLIIAGTYTPLTILMLPHSQAVWLIWTVWVGAILGILMRMFWLNAPRWIYTPIYIGLGWVAVAYLPGFYDGGGLAVLLLVIIGGCCYTGGAICYALKKPNPSPKWFGFHEIFHSATVAGWTCHVIAIFMVATSASA